MTIKIKMPPANKRKPGEPFCGFGIQVLTHDDKPIAGVRDIQISMSLEDAVTATVEVFLDALQEPIEAHPLLGFDTLQAAARHYGYALIKAEKK
jgi:hypothetical protein